MAKDRLEVTLRRRRDDKVFKPRTVWADHRDEDSLREVLVSMARDLDGTKGDAEEFAEGYELEVHGVDRRWIDFRLPGRKG